MRIIQMLVLVCLAFGGRAFGQETYLSFAQQGEIPSTCGAITLTAHADKVGRPYLYVAARAGGLRVYRLDSGNSLVGEVAIGDLDGLQVNNIYQDGNFLYLAMGNFFGTNKQIAGLGIVNVSDPTEPSVVGKWSGEDTSSGAGIVVVENNVAYLGAMRQGLILFDVADKSDVREITRFVPEIEFPDVNVDPAKVNARGMAVRNGYVYLCYDAGGFRVIDVSNTNEIEEVGRYSNPAVNGLPRAYNNVVLSGDLAFVAVDYCGLEILDISNPTSPELVGWWNPWNCQSNPFNWFFSDGHTNEIAYLEQEELVFLSGGKTDLVAVDVSDRMNPVYAGHYGSVGDQMGTWGVTVDGEDVYLAYICTLGVPFPANWSGVKVLRWDRVAHGGTGWVAE